MRKILSLDGGGIRGIIPAVLLRTIEQRTGKRICELFDLIAGTSTGGILAIGLSIPDHDNQPRYTADDMLKLYFDRGRDIFSRSFWKGVASIGGLTDEKYSHKPLEIILNEYFSLTEMKDALTNLLISTYDIENRNPLFLKSWKDKYGTVPMTKAARATSAAPTYFEPAQVLIDGFMCSLVDGGVFVNNPAMSAYAEAHKLFHGEEALVVSLGTGELTRPIRYDDARGWGLIEWAIPILNVVFDGVNDAVDYQLTQILGDKFYRFQTRLDIASDDMDNASKANIEALYMEATNLIKNNDKRLDEICSIIS